MLDVKDIHTYYGDSYVLQGVSLTVSEGQVVALMGRNGVGKNDYHSIRCWAHASQNGKYRLQREGNFASASLSHRLHGYGIGPTRSSHLRILVGSRAFDGV